MNKKIKKKKIKNFIFVADAFGELPIWSLMHPTKEAEEAYMLIPVKRSHLDKPHMAKYRNFFKRWNKYMDYGEMYITGTIWYEHIDEMDIIRDMTIERVLFYPFLDDAEEIPYLPKELR